MRKRRRPALEENKREALRLVYLRPQEITGGMVRERAVQSPQQLALLAASIARYGLLSPLIVRKTEGAPGYRLVCGARRLAACRLLGMEYIPALLIDADDAQAAACFMEEHLTYEAPCALDEARAILLSGGVEAAKESVLPDAAFLRRLALLELDEETKHIARTGALSLEQAEPLLSVVREDLRQEAARMIAERQLTGAQAQRLVFGPGMKASVVSTSDKALDVRAGAPDGRTRQIEQEKREIDANTK